MNYQCTRVTLDNCHTVTGTVVVIDVLRAFTTAAFAFAAGAEKIDLVATIEEAFELRRRHSGALIIGEKDGLPVDGFDFWNSPSEIRRQHLNGRHLIQRTTAGTQGVVRSRSAEILLTTGLCTAQATVDYIRRHSSPAVTFVITGRRPGRDGDEDAACADYLTARLNEAPVEPDKIAARVRQSTPGRKFADPREPVFPFEDLEMSLRFDCFDFAMVVTHRNGRFTLRPHFQPPENIEP